MLDHIVSELLPGNVLADLLVSGEQSVDPLLLGQAEHADAETPLLDNAVLPAVSQPGVGAFVMHVAQQPREVGLRLELKHVLQGVVQVVVAQAGQVDFHGV